jgi:hypothetical protein
MWNALGRASGAAKDGGHGDNKKKKKWLQEMPHW